jgi:hypothetical protein
MQEAIVACTLTHPVKGAPKLTTYLWSTAALFLFRYALQIGRYCIMEYLWCSLETRRRDIELPVQ